MASTDARPVPRKNVAFRVTFPLLDADGDLVTGASSLDSEVSKDGGTFADCTNEATEIATSSGMYYLDLTSTEMNADTVAIIVKSASAKTTTLVLYPEEAGDYRADTVLIEGADPSDTIRDAVVDDATRIDASALNTASVTTIPAILADTAEIGTAGAGLTNINLPNQTMDIVGNITGNLSGSVGSVTGAINTAAGVITTLDALDTAQDSQHSTTQTAIADLPTNSELATALAGADDAVLAAVAALNDPTAAAIADAVWTEAIADHSGVSGSTAEALAAAGSAGDPWATALPGAYSAGQAGKIVGDNLNATVSSRATQTSVDDIPTNSELTTALADLPTNSELATALGTADDAVLAAVATTDGKVDAIKAKTDDLTFTVPNQVDVNIESVNGTTVEGSGTPADPWGP